MIDDVLEQIVEDYFREKGYFTQHNVKYRPNKKGSAYAVYSDIDILGIHPLKKGKKKVIVVSCKSWQGGLDIKKTLKQFKADLNKKDSGREVWKRFRELVNKTWAKALRDKVYRLTRKKDFEFYLAVTKYKGDKDTWENFPLFKRNLPGCRIKLIDMKAMILDLEKSLTTTPAHSELSRLLQLIKADKGKIIYKDLKE